MASQTIRSSSVTFLDTTDDRKLEVYIASTLPTTQIFNANNNTYTPDWSTTNLQLNADVFLDSKEITSDTQASIIWYEKIGTGAKTQIGTGASLIISTNKMAGNVSIITYICETEYQDITARNQITFNRSDTGLNGADGTSVTILSSYDTLEDLQVAHPTGNEGDAYIIDGDLYVWNVDDSIWKNVGKIQGPQGENAKSIILNADAQVFRVSKTNIISPTTINVTAQTVNTIVSEDGWTYSVNGGQTFLSTVPNGVIRNGNIVTITGANMSSNSVIIKASDGTYSDTYTVYKVFDGVDGEQGSKGDSAPIAFLTNENITFSADAQGRISGNIITSNVIAYRGNQKVLPEIGSIEGIPEDYVRANPNSFDENIIYYVYPENNPTEIIEADPQPTAENFKDGQYYIKSMLIATENTESNEVKLSISIADGATLGIPNSTHGEISIYIRNPVITTLHLGWSKINTGASGAKGSDAITFQIYSENGYVLSKEVPNITLCTFAYDGSKQIETGAIYRWYKRVNDAWVQIDDAIDDNFSISHYDVDFNCSYMCKMIYNGAEYFSVVTIDDKNDINRVFTSKPESYIAGDIWVVGNDYQPEQITIGTILRAEHTNSQYNDSDWVTATKYDEQLKNLQKDIDNYNQYFSFNSQQGLVISAKDENGTPSKFSTSLSNTQLSFNYDNEAVASISNSKMHIKEAEIESPLTVTGRYSGATMLQAPTINLGNFSLVVESNGSLSIISNL